MLLNTHVNGFNESKPKTYIVLWKVKFLFGTIWSFFYFEPASNFPFIRQLES